ncbi:MAG: hypothetical protein WBZ36_14880 [Candidatus Nitrosopolaris sp.]
MNKLLWFGLLFALLLFVSVSSVTVKKAFAISFSNGPCPSGEARDYMGVCYPIKECKASISAQPGSCTQSEKYAGCPSGQIKDWAGICFKESEAKACPTCAPGSAAAAEKPSTSPPKIEAEKSTPFLKDVEKMKAAPHPKCHSGSYAQWITSQSKWVCFPRHIHGGYGGL